MKIKHALLVTSTLFSASLFASTSRWSGDWFEIEVILLSQLHDRTQVREVFQHNKALPNYTNSLDLLADYLQPDIASLKQQLPLCDAPEYPKSLVEQSSQLPTFPKVYSLDELQTLPVDDELEQLLAEDRLQIELAQQSQEQQSTTDNDNFFDRMAKVEQSSNNDVPLESVANEENLTALATAQIEIEKEETPELTEDEIQFVTLAEQAFTPYPLNYQHLATPSENNTLCRISEEQYKALNINDPRYSYLGYGVLAMPTIIDGIEDLYNPHSYLISRESFELNDVYTQLRRSKNFRPILHLGWRQQVYELPTSTPIKLYAGDHLAYNYQQALATYQEQKHQLIEQEKQLAEALAKTPSINDNDQQNIELLPLSTTQQSSAQQLAKAKHERIAQLLETLNNEIDTTTPLETLIATPQALSSETGEAFIDTPPQAPIQPWFLDGFLNVYLIGNFLNVSADFNIMNMSLGEIESEQLKPNSKIDLQTINFSQKRRMISQETHYFDHPYMGMVIQIRRHTRPEVEQDTDTQEQ